MLRELHAKVPGVQGRDRDEEVEEGAATVTVGNIVPEMVVVSRARRDVGEEILTEVVGMIDTIVLSVIVGGDTDGVTVNMTVTPTGSDCWAVVEAMELVEGAMLVMAVKVEFMLISSDVLVRLGRPVPVSSTARVLLLTMEGPEVVVVEAEAGDVGAAIVDAGLDPVVTKPGPGLGVMASWP